MESSSSPSLSSSSRGKEYSKELDVAVRVVQMACSLCQRVQDGIVAQKKDQIKAKDDDSPVTVAGIIIFKKKKSFFLLIL